MGGDGGGEEGEEGEEVRLHPISHSIRLDIK